MTGRGAGGFLLRDVDLGGQRADVRLHIDPGSGRGTVQAIGRLTRQQHEQVVEGGGGALLPGLHDHHIHLLALAALDSSVDVSLGTERLERAAARPSERWVRATSWNGDETELDRDRLDRIAPSTPVRVQHRSGALWVLNSAALERLGLAAPELGHSMADGDLPAGVERDPAGRLTGRFYRCDDWLGRRIGRSAPDLAGLSARLAALGLTGLTDATPGLDSDSCRLLRGSVRQHLQLLGDPSGRGPMKIVLADHELPSYDELMTKVAAARPRPVAIHCVTREALVLLLAVLDDIGRHPSDRIEHAALVPEELLADLPTCVTQPAILTSRGDDYLRRIPQSEWSDLYRYQSLLRAGTCVVPSSDAPYGPVDPWLILKAARDRLSAAGQPLGGPGVEVGVALDGLLRPLDDLRAPARRIEVGTAADIVLLHTDLVTALARPDSSLVRATWIDGVLAYTAENIDDD